MSSAGERIVGHDADSLAGDAPGGEGERVRRCRVEPADVVDDDESRPALSELFQQAGQGHTHGSWIGVTPRRRRGAQRGDVERLLLDVGQRPANLVDGVIGQIGEADERETSLGFLTGAAQYAVTTRLGRGCDSPDDCRLADTSLALDQQRSGLFRQPVEECGCDREFVVASDDSI